MKNNMIKNISSINTVPITFSNNSLVSINVSFPTISISFKNNDIYEKFVITTLNTHEVIYKEPIHINEEISLDEWKRSLQYSDTQVIDTFKKILLDFELDVDDDNLELLEKMIYNLIDIYEKKYRIELDDDTRKMLRNLITRMSYDKLCIKQYV